MKKILSLSLIISIGFSNTLVVEKCHKVGIFEVCNNCTSGTDYKSIADALNNASSGDEIVICPDVGGVKAIYNESDLNVTDTNLYIHSYKNDASKVEIKDNSGNPIFNIQSSGTDLEALTITQDATQEDINVTGNINNLKFKDLIINSQGKGIVFQHNINNTFDDVNITSKDVCLENDWSEFRGVKIENSEFNQTSNDAYALLSFATNYKDNNFSNLEINSSGYGAKFSKIKDSNFTNFYLNSNNDAFVVDSGNIDNMRFIDSNLSSNNGRGFSVTDGNLTNSYLDDFNISSGTEAIYTKEDINNSTINNFIINGDNGLYADEYIRNSTIQNGEINVTQFGIYSSKELNQTTLKNLKITAQKYALWFSENSASGAVNDENNLTDLIIIQTSNSSTSYSGIKFLKKLNNSLIDDVNISATEKGLWLSTGGNYNTFSNSEFNSSENNGFVNSNPITYNTFSNVTIYSKSSTAASFNGDVKNNTFDTIYIKSDNKNGIYGGSDSNISSNDFRNFRVFADDYGIYFKDSIDDNNFTNFYVRVNNQKGFKFAQYSTNDYFLNIDTNGTKGIDFNISEDDIVQNAKIYTTQNEPIYFDTIKSGVKLYDLNLTSTEDNCIYVGTLDADLNISTIDFYKNEFNCSDYNGIQISNDSTNSLSVKNTNFIFNATSTDTSRALIDASSLDTLYVKNDSFDANKTRRGIYISSNLNNVYIYNSLFKDTNDTAVYINKVNNYMDMEDNNITTGQYGIYIKYVNSGFNKGEIKNNVFNDCSDYAVDIFDGNENDNADFEIWSNCFFDNQNTNGESQAYTYDADNAKYDDGKAGNFWSDWNESGKYQIDPSSIDLYDNHPLYYCPLTKLFDARDVDRNFTDRNISIKIAGKDFNLTIFDVTGGEYNGTVCSRILDNDDNSTAYTDWMKLSFNNDIEKNLTDIEVNNSAPDAIVHMVWASGDKSCNDVLNGDHNASFSTDTFAIRPYRYKVKFSKMPLFAGEAFDLNMSAVDFNDNLLDDYNESDVNISADMNKSVLVCDYPHAEFNLSTIDFTNGESNNSAKFDEVGEMNLSVFDNKFDEAKGGVQECNDSNACISVYGYDGKDSNGVFCCNIEANPVAEMNLSKPDINLSEVDIKVYDLNITRNEINTPYNTDWIYMDSNLSEFNASAVVEITAFNKEGKQLHNFDKTCVAKDMNISFGYDLHNNNGDINLTYVGTVNDNNKSITDFNKTMEVNKSVFAKGDTNASYAFNVDRNKSIPLYIVYGNLKDINFTTNNIAKNENNLSTDLNISMYYGNIQSFDVFTNKNDIDVKIYFAVYNDGSDYAPSNINKEFNWYLNTKHTKKEGEFNSTIHISDGYTASDKYNDDFDVTVDDTSDGSQVFHITRKNKNISFAVFHLSMDENISHWLWFSKNEKDYNDSINSTCAHHFCFAITWKEANNQDNSKTVESGENLLGTEANITEYNRTSKGVKIYR